MINIDELKKKIIYRSNYRGTKEMDNLLLEMLNKEIDKENVPGNVPGNFLDIFRIFSGFVSDMFPELFPTISGFLPEIFRTFSGDSDHPSRPVPLHPRS